MNKVQARLLLDISGKMYVDVLANLNGMLEAFNEKFAVARYTFSSSFSSSNTWRQTGPSGQLVRQNSLTFVAQDAWDIQACNSGSWLVIPTNIGWKANGENVMGRGLAKQAASRFPTIAKTYGKWCKDYGCVICKIGIPRLILAPSKALNKQNPGFSWANSSDIETVAKSYEQLSSLSFTKTLIVPLLGTGNGDMDVHTSSAIALRFTWSHETVFVLKREQFDILFGHGNDRL